MRAEEVPNPGLRTPERTCAARRSPGFAQWTSHRSKTQFNQFIAMKLTLLTAATGAIVLSTQVTLGQSTFTKITTGDIVSDGGSSNSGIWLDYDNDGDLDLYVVNGDPSALLPSAGHEPNFLYRNDGHGTFTKITSGPLVEDLEKSICGAAGDYNNDGYIDLFVGNLGMTDNSRYRNNGDGFGTGNRAPRSWSQRGPGRRPGG